MGIQNNTVQACIITERGQQLKARYLKFMKELNDNDLIDWVEIKEELNGHYGEYLLPNGIIARNIDRISTECEGSPWNTTIPVPGKVDTWFAGYKFNFANMEDDDIQELLDGGYIQII